MAGVSIMKKIAAFMALALTLLNGWGLPAQNEKGYDPDVFALPSERRLS